MVSDSQHWNNIFDNAEGQELGWHEDNCSQTFKLLAHTNLSAQSRVFLPGAGTSTLVDELLKTHCHLTLNDISDVALAKLDATLKSAKIAPNYDLLHHNIGQPFNQDYAVDIWIDRAVLHFLLTEQEISTYFANLSASLKRGGYVLLAEFSDTGAKKCAGLEIHQYSLSEMQSRLGSQFKLVTCEDYVFVNPFGQERPYIYALFQRI